MRLYPSTNLLSVVLCPALKLDSINLADFLLNHTLYVAEIFEFNATEDLPSTMDVEVFDYDGPFSEAESLGHGEINFLKQGLGVLADSWISLSGKSALAHGSRLHIRVNLINTQETDGLPGYIERVEREVGAKVHPLSF
jgi:hypothetical protein